MRYCCLPRHAFEYQKVGGQLGLSAAYCISVASFYDTYHLSRRAAPDRGVTNISCAPSSARSTLEAFNNSRVPSR